MGEEVLSKKTSIDWVAFESLSGEEKETLVEWIYSMDESYYSIFSSDKNKIYKSITEICMSKLSEFNSTRYFRINKKLLGFLTYYPSEEIFQRRIEGLKILMKIAEAKEDVKNKIKILNSPDPVNEKNSLYLSKIYVAKKVRGLGIFRYLILDYINSGLISNQKLILHVSKLEINTINIYKKYKFQLDKVGSTSNYYLMRYHN